MVKCSGIIVHFLDTERPTSSSPTGSCVKEIDFVGHFNKEWECLFENFCRPPAATGSELKIYCKRYQRSTGVLPAFYRCFIGALSVFLYVFSVFSGCSVEVSRGGGAYNDFQLPEAEQRRMFDFYTVGTASVQVSSVVMDEM
ncbi:hypothetical protein D9C73_027582 [Collichthys lucidus]|uniref:Uncharacterized protein n=1 Tax=Collichthys lucidus TaxID=240159 RepID=A0A4U5TW93_COLLU|nr:hypothetical protein D9C73_027582 [Collichthys lucidus]